MPINKDKLDTIKTLSVTAVAVGTIVGTLLSLYVSSVLADHNSSIHPSSATKEQLEETDNRVKDNQRDIESLEQYFKTTQEFNEKSYNRLDKKLDRVLSKLEEQ